MRGRGVAGIGSELLQAVVLLWQRVSRWVVRSPRNLIISVSVLVVVLVVASGVLWQGPSRPVAQDFATPTPTPSVSYAQITATPDVGEPVATGEAAPEESAAQSVATEWFTVYLTRDRAEDLAWRDAVGPYTMPQVVQGMTPHLFFEPGALVGKTPTSVQTVEFSAPQPNAETNTPVRWSRTVTVQVATNSGTTVTLDFAIVVVEGDAGWIVTAVDLLGSSEA